MHFIANVSEVFKKYVYVHSLILLQKDEDIFPTTDKHHCKAHGAIRQNIHTCNNDTVFTKIQFCDE